MHIHDVVIAPARAFINQIRVHEAQPPVAMARRNVIRREVIYLRGNAVVDLAHDAAHAARASSRYIMRH